MDYSKQELKWIGLLIEKDIQQTTEILANWSDDPNYKPLVELRRDNMLALLEKTHQLMQKKIQRDTKRMRQERGH